MYLEEVPFVMPIRDDYVCLGMLSESKNRLYDGMIFAQVNES